jgi:transcriptional regulator with XRE-family HTH domain
MLPMHVRGLRLDRGWSQEDLAERSGLSVRTIQRIENGQQPGLASARALAGAFDVDVTQLGPAADPGWAQQPMVASVRTCLVKFAVFDGRATRTEYWWFVLFAGIATALSTLISDTLGAVTLVVLLLPLLAAGARRLHDTGRSGWWQLLAAVPFGFVVPLILLASATVEPVGTSPGDQW